MILTLIEQRSRDPPHRLKPHNFEAITAHSHEPQSTEKSTANAQLKTLENKGFVMINSTEYDVTAHVTPHVERTYTAQEIAQQHNVKDVTVRTRWFKWLLKVAPEALLKAERSYTELANTLFAEFAAVDKKERHAWVADAKHRYASEWGSVGVIECEVVPDNVGSTLALLSANNNALQETIALQVAQCDSFIDGLNAADNNISEAEMQAAIARGTSRATKLFMAEEAAKEQMGHALRQRRMNGGTAS